MADFKDTVRDLGKALAAKQNEAKQSYATFTKLREDMVSAGVDLLTDQESFDKLDEAGKAYDALCDEINSMQAKFNRLMEISGSDAPLPPESGQRQTRDAEARLPFAERFKSSAAWEYIKATSGPGRNLKFGVSPSAEIIERGEVQATLMTTTSYPSEKFRRPGIVALPQAPLTILDLIPWIPTDKETVEYVYEKTFTNAAVETAEGEAAPEGVLDFDAGSVACKWIPFAIPTTRQLLSDEPRLEAWINERLPRGVRTRLQTQVISGTAVGEGNSNNLTGIINWPNILSQDAGSFTKPDLVHKAKTQIIVASQGENVPNVLLIHPDDEERLVLDKDSEDRYYFGGPGYDGVRTIWGMLPVVHPSVPEGNPVVLDVGVCEGYVREGVTVSVSDSHSDYFTKNKVMWLAQMRAAFLITRPSGVCEITSFDS